MAVAAAAAIAPPTRAPQARLPTVRPAAGQAPALAASTASPTSTAGLRTPAASNLTPPAQTQAPAAAIVAADTNEPTAAAAIAKAAPGLAATPYPTGAPGSTGAPLPSTTAAASQPTGSLPSPSPPPVNAGSKPQSAVASAGIQTGTSALGGAAATPAATHDSAGQSPQPAPAAATVTAPEHQRPSPTAKATPTPAAQPTPASTPAARPAQASTPTTQPTTTTTTTAATASTTTASTPLTAGEAPPTTAVGEHPAPALTYGVNLHQAIEAVHATVEMATRQGLSQARIELEPAELGAIRIHLTQTAQGLIARVSADTPAAAQALAEGRSELRQSLTSLGLTALHLNGSASDQAGMQQQHDPASRGHDLFGPSPNPDRSADPQADEDHDTGAGDAPSDLTPAAPGSTRGALVDVLA